MTSPTPSTPSPSRSVEPVVPLAEALHAAVEGNQYVCLHTVGGFRWCEAMVPDLLAALPGHILVERAELDRLRAVEAAARTLDIADKGFGPVVSSRSLRALARALTRKQP